eukprot:CAMPEP_0205886124 /NCGR_PEP_ID=MMETSP1083-20121108/19072_1 /ASSEMBLY_ACC=CAM_ASM_000430 /TAXON_ID=97485 /ORGANISM="Prymnesium parvum, Strain Texoma1" /LENGTH=106 /DNA_ID=CAMNT_0053249747 /DNA_START=125 /DNA_END=445 /DNA_ORIENTATION=+
MMATLLLLRSSTLLVLKLEQAELLRLPRGGCGARPSAAPRVRRLVRPRDRQRVGGAEACRRQPQRALFVAASRPLAFPTLPSAITARFLTLFKLPRTISGRPISFL